MSAGRGASSRTRRDARQSLAHTNCVRLPMSDSAGHSWFARVGLRRGPDHCPGIAQTVCAALAVPTRSFRPRMTTVDNPQERIEIACRGGKPSATLVLRANCIRVSTAPSPIRLCLVRPQKPMPPARFTMEERRVAHATELFEVLRDPCLYEFLDEAPPKSAKELAEKLARSEHRKSPDGKEHWLNWVVRGETGAIAGYVQSTVEESKEVNVAYVFSRAFKGQGIATAAVRRMIELVVTEYQPTTLFIVTESGNLPSLRLAERLGFTKAPAQVAATRQPRANEVVLWLQPTSPH